jgi:agmatine deiminase
MFPKDYHYKMPAEWEKHDYTIMEWPVQDAMVWPENYKEVCEGYARVANAISAFEPVLMLVNPASFDEARALCNSRVEFLVMDFNDSWSRDNGPTFLLNDKGERAGVNWKFNAWGEKYGPWDLDDTIAPRLLKHFGEPCFDAPFVLEGGSIHTDGEETLLTTEECLLNPNRNPELSKEEIENLLRQYLNIEKVIWLKRGLDGDETDGHIDNIACFARPGVIIMQVCDDPSDPNYEITRENLEILKHATDAKGRKLEVITIEQPPRMEYRERRLTLSYLNFYFVNGGIVLPVFGGQCEEADLKAKEVLQATFPDREVVMVPSLSIVKEGGNIHCITQQVPAKKKE